MGWTSTADPLENMARANMFFYTKEEAIAFCTKNAWEYEVDEPKQRRNDRQKRFNAYGDNYRCVLLSSIVYRWGGHNRGGRSL